MELDYPTIKNHHINQQINHLDKLGRSILLSLRDIPSNSNISKGIKERILKIISKDNVCQLNKIIDKEVIRFDISVGSKGSNWNVLHFCVKSDASKCVQYVLKKQYQQLGDQYIKLINSRTIQGYTPIIIAIINRSNRSLEKLLNFGGVDLHIMDQHKMSPYQIALNYKNDAAIRLLMNYEALTRKKLFLNRDALREPFYFPQQKGLYKSYFGTVLCCLTFGLVNFGQQQPTNEQNGQKASFFSHKTQFIDCVHIGSKKQLPGYDIQWQKASQLHTGYKIPLFDSFNPFEIRQPNFTIKNNLMIFQCLSQQPWLIRRIIKLDKSKNNFYEVNLYPNKIHEKIHIDEHIPYLKQRKEPMFLADSTELWSMLIQKSLAKHHKAYFDLNQLQPQQVLEEISGFPTFKKKLSNFKNTDLISFLQKLSSKNYLVILQGKKGSGLNQSEDSVDCFTILNYYQTKNDNLVLVNCPFISEAWKVKQKNQPLALKLIKGHYNSHNQMCVWVEQKNLPKYFENVIVSLALTNYERLQVKFRSSNIIFFKLRIQSSRQQPVTFELLNQDTEQIYDLKGMQIIKNEGQQQIAHKFTDSTISQKIVQLETKAGEYMCYIELQKNPQSVISNFLLLCFSIDFIQVQFVQQQFGILQWFGYLKTYFTKINQKCIAQTIRDHTLILLRETQADGVELHCQTLESQIIEGKRVDQQTIELIKDSGIYYCVLRKIIDPSSIVFNYR